MALYGGSDFVLPFYHDLHDAPLRIPSETRIFRQNVLDAAARPADLVTFCALRLGIGSRRSLIGDPLADAEKSAGRPGALLTAIGSIYSATGKTMTAQDRVTCAAGIRHVPADVQRQAAFVLSVERSAYRWRQIALSAFPGHHNLQQVFDKLVSQDPNQDDNPYLDREIETLMHTIDMPRLMVGGEDVTLAADRAARALEKRSGAERFSFVWDTPLGRVALHGIESDTYPGDVPYLLTIDTGGDNVYYGGGATFDAAHPVSVLIDLAGNARFVETPELLDVPIWLYEGRKQHKTRPCFGAGVLGYGVVVKKGGDNLYRAVNQTMGRGNFGVGVLVTDGTNAFDGYTNCQGSADFGVGILDDLGGQDNFRCFTLGQGYGGSMGFGLLCHPGPMGSVFEAMDGTIDFPSAQTPQHNTSLAQGCGCGWRADYADGHSLAGGIGALVVSGGDNRYSAGLFAQGAGYWYGIGILSSGRGNDTYRGVWYVQGSAAHFAVGILEDIGGADQYTAIMNMAQGAGHDFSVGFSIDDDGHDRFQAPNLSLGSGNENGFGFFWDKGGGNTYDVKPSTTLGGASIEAGTTRTVRERNLTLGIFLDTGGGSHYPPEIPAAHAGAHWTLNDTGSKPALPTMRGAGLDIDAPATPDPG